MNSPWTCVCVCSFHIFLGGRNTHVYIWMDGWMDGTNEILEVKKKRDSLMTLRAYSVPIARVATQGGTTLQDRIECYYVFEKPYCNERLYYM